MKVTMCEVNFGETILYEDGAHKLLVDCGAKFGEKGKLAYNRVKNEIDDKTQLLITHFDEDHYNGIIQIPDTQKFEKIYLPLYIFKDKKLESIEDVFIDVIKTWTYSIVIGQPKKINALHSLFMKLPQLVNSVRDICCVGNGDSFLLEAETIDVLWPEKNFKVKRRMHADEVLERLRDNIAGNQNVELFEEFVSLADDYVNTLLNIYRFYCVNGQRDNAPYMSSERYNEESEKLNDIFAKISGYRFEFNLNVSERKRLTTILSNNIKNMNECSVVFEVKGEIIAFGDISERIIKYMKKCNIMSCDKYKIVKVQHHGTKRYWSDELPAAKVYLISNSGEKNQNWSIDERYGLNYAEKVACTNDNDSRCEYSSGDKKCKMCNIVLKRRKIIFDCAAII